MPFPNGYTLYNRGINIIGRVGYSEPVISDILTIVIGEVTDVPASYNIINLTAWGRFETIPAKCDHLPIAQVHFSINRLKGHK